MIDLIPFAATALIFLVAFAVLYFFPPHKPPRVSPLPTRPAGASSSADPDWLGTINWNWPGQESRVPLFWNRRTGEIVYGPDKQGAMTPVNGDPRDYVPFTAFDPASLVVGPGYLVPVEIRESELPLIPGGFRAR